MRSSRKVTLTDVAARAGVSATTASYILNGRSAEMRISADAADRVRRAAVDLAYRPNRTARSLRTASTKTIGLISDFVASGQFASQMLTGASAEARARDHLLVTAESEGDPELEALLVEEMLDHQVDGIVFATLAAREVTVPAPLRSENVVLLNCFDSSASLRSVLPDDLEGGRVAARAVMDAGVAQDVVVVGWDVDSRATAGPLRGKGIEEVLGQAGFPVAARVVCDWDVVPAYEAVDDWLARGRVPSAMICLNDRIAMGTYQALARRRLEIPDDVAVVSFDGSNLAAWQRPPVASILLPLAELGRAAVRLLLQEQGPDPRERLLLPMPLVPGGSLPNAAVRSGRRAIGGL